MIYIINTCFIGFTSTPACAIINSKIGPPEYVLLPFNPIIFLLVDWIRVVR